MKKTLTILMLSASLPMSLASCGVSDEVLSIAGNSDSKLIWVWAQFNVPSKDSEFDNYYYYGRVPQTLFSKISANKITSGFILMKDARFWGKDDVIHTFKDRENTGDILFRIEDIRYVELIANAPIVGRGKEQYADAKPAASSSSSTSSIKAGK